MGKYSNKYFFILRLDNVVSKLDITPESQVYPMEELGHVYGWLVIACLLDFVFGILLGFTVGVFTSLLSRLTRDELHTANF